MLFYAFMKGIRERFLVPFAFAPAVLLGSIVLGLSAQQALGGDGIAFPFRIATVTYADTNALMLLLVVAFAAASSASAAFWVFRSDIADRGVAFFIVALPSGTRFAAAAALFGWSVGVASALIAIPLALSAAQTIISGTATSAALAVVACFAAACAGVLVASFTSSTGGLLSASVLGLIVAGLVIDSSSTLVTGIAAVAGLVAIYAGVRMERRCAY